MKDAHKIWDKRYSSSTVSSTYDDWLEPWRPLLGTGGMVLDLGCGRGYDTQYLISNGYQVVAVDFSKTVLSMVRQNVGQARIVQVDVRHGLPFLAQQFQIVIANLSLHYFPWKQTCSIVEQVRNCLRPQGKLLTRFNSINDVNFGARGHREAEKNYFEVNGEMKRFFNRESLEELFGTGWKIERLEEKTIHRFGKPKMVWELIAEKDDQK